MQYLQEQISTTLFLEADLLLHRWDGGEDFIQVVDLLPLLLNLRLQVGLEVPERVLVIPVLFEQFLVIAHLL